MFFDDPNFLLVKEENLKPDELVELYTESLYLANTKEGIEDLLWSFLEDVEYMVLREVLIVQAKRLLGDLEELEEVRKFSLDLEGE